MSGPLSDFLNAITVKISFQNHDRLKKTAGIFAGLGHLQPLLLATTNSHYLLDRFCMERCCSGEYISRIVTSIIFMEVLSIIVVRIVLYGVFIDWSTWTKWSTEWSGATGTTLNTWNENKEEKYRGIVSCIILCLITLGYIQIFYAFIYGGRKGHMHWFYTSLLIQHFLNSLIAGSIGFWEVGLALWYLVALPMAPIVVFFYQLYIHSWIRNNGPRYPELLVVEWQIILATAISCIATLLWTYAYAKPYVPIELEIKNLDSTTSPDSQPSTDDSGRINAGPTTLQTANLSGTNGAKVTKQSEDLTLPGLSNVKATATLTAYSLTLVTIEDSSSKKITLTIKAGVKIEFSGAENDGTIEVKTATLTEQLKTLALNTASSRTSNIDLRPGQSVADVNKPSNNTVDISLTVEEIRVTAAIEALKTIESVKITIPVRITMEVKQSGVGGQPATTETINYVDLTLPTNPTTSAGPEYSEKQKLDLTVTGGQTLSITVNAQAGGDAQTNEPGAKFVKVSGTAFTSKAAHHCIYSVVDKGTATRDIWVNLGGKCTFAACYKKNNIANKALLMLYHRSGEHVEKKYFGKDTNWYEITKAKFIENLEKLANNNLNLSNTDGKVTDQYNREYDKVLFNPTSWWNTPSATWFPLVMHGVAVGSFGSIFPNLIPKTLVCARSSRTLTVWSIFLSPVPHIINLALAEYDLLSKIGVGAPWKGGFHTVWSLYLIYILAILFAIFNVHSPEWRLCSFLRNNTWIPLMMTILDHCYLYASNTHYVHMLRIHLVTIHSSTNHSLALKYAGLQNPLDAPHHLRSSEWLPYREGVIKLLPKSHRGKNTEIFAECGIFRNVKVKNASALGSIYGVELVTDDEEEVYQRVTIRLDGSSLTQCKQYWRNNKMGSSESGDYKLSGYIVSPEEPLQRAGLYWGYNVREAESVEGIFECPFDSGEYDYKIGTSERGETFGPATKLPKYKNLLVVFGPVNGLEHVMENPSEKFDKYYNFCLHQKSRTIRTEEALAISLAIMNFAAPY